MHQGHCEFRGRKEEKVSSCPSSLYIPIGPIRGVWKKTQLSKILCWPTGHGNVTLLPLYFPVPLPHTFSSSYSPSLAYVCLFHFHYCRPAPSPAPPSVPASLCAAVLSICMPLSCLSNLSELFKTLSPLLFIYFFTPNVK